jgi:hypothetical protein
VSIGIEGVTSYGNPLDTNPDAAGLPSDLRDTLASWVTDHFDTYYRQRLYLEKKWDYWYRQYRCLEDGDDSTRPNEKSQIKIPACKEAVSNATDAIFNIVCAEGGWFDIAPGSPDLYHNDPMISQLMLEDKAHRASLVKRFVEYLFGKENVEGKIHGAITDMCIYGTTVGRVVATQKTLKHIKHSTKLHPIHGPDGEVMDNIPESTTESVEQDVIHPEFEHIPIENFYIDANCTGLQAKDNCNGFVIRSYKKRHEVARLFPELRNKGKDALDVGGVKVSNSPDKSGNTPNVDEVKRRRLLKQGITYTLSGEDLELLEYWGFVDNANLIKAGLEPASDASGGKEMCVIVADRMQTLKAEENPFPTRERPFVSSTFDPVNNEFYGIGVMELSMGPAKALDASARSRIDNMQLSLNNIFGINVNKFIKGQNLGLHPGKALLFNGDPRESFFPLQIPDVTAKSSEDRAEFINYIRSGHGISPLVGGMPAKSGEQTATEVSSMLGQSATRIKTIVKRFENNVIIPMLRWYTRILIQYMPAPETFMMFNSQTAVATFEQIKQEDLSEDFDFIPKGSVNLSAQNTLQKRIQAMQLASNPLVAQFTNLKYLWGKVYEAMGFNDDEVALAVQPPPMQNPQLQQMNSPQGSAPALPPGSPQSNTPNQVMAPNAPMIPGGGR